jgi:hypothetical protein
MCRQSQRYPQIVVDNHVRMWTRTTLNQMKQTWTIWPCGRSGKPVALAARRRDAL